MVLCKAQRTMPLFRPLLLKPEPPWLSARSKRAGVISATGKYLRLDKHAIAIHAHITGSGIVQRKESNDPDVMEPFKTTAVFNGKHYHHFGIHPRSAFLYGNDPKDIVELTMKLANDQDVPEHIAGEKSNPNADYWGWYSNEDERFVFIWQAYLLLDMCFPYGMKAEEERGRGKAYRLEIESEPE